MTLPVLAGLVAAAVAVAAALTGALSRPGSRWSILDLPNERSLHVRPTPRTGGLAIVVVIVVGWTAIALGWGLDRRFAWIAGGAALVAMVSFADDRRTVSAGARMLIHVAAAAMLIAGGLGIERVPFPGVSAELGDLAGGALTLLFVVWMINLYNFMDGMDGFAGGMAIFGFGFLAHALWSGGAPTAAAAALIIVGGALGFLRHNFPPAKIFLGDVGAAPLGFLAAALALHGDHAGAIPLWASVLVFSPFVVDATVTLARRALRGEKVWQAHRTHYYQRLVQLGWGHRKTVLAEYVVMLACGASATAVLHASARVQQVTLAAWVGLYAALMLSVARLERARTT